MKKHNNSRRKSEPTLKRAKSRGPVQRDTKEVLAELVGKLKEKLDPKGVPQCGLVAEDVAKVDPDLVARDSKGKPYTVRYEAVNAMLLNEFIKEHRKVEEQAATIEQQERRLTELERTVADWRQSKH